MNTVGSVLVASSGVIRVDGAGADDIVLTAGTDVSVRGELFAIDDITLSANDDIEIKGSITTGDQINVHAGVDATGSVLGDIYTGLTSINSGLIDIVAGTTAGAIDLTNATLSTGGAMNLNALAGPIFHGGGLMSASSLSVRALSGFNANAVVGSISIILGGAGDVVFVNQGDLLVDGAVLPNGRLSVTGIGAVEARNVSLQGGGG